jgi:hypothetical protein
MALINEGKEKERREKRKLLMKGNYTRVAGERP